MLGAKQPRSSITWGIPGRRADRSAFVLTGIYVRRANGEFDDLNKAILKEASNDPSSSPGRPGLRRVAPAAWGRCPDRRGAETTAERCRDRHVRGSSPHPGITYWASKRNKSAADYYAAGGGITGFQNGLAIAGDYMSAASFLGISALVFTSGYDGLIYSIGFLVGWPIILFLIGKRLRNLGKYTFADVASYRLKQKEIRTLSASGSLVVVAFYLIAQMVGAGKLIQLLFGLTTMLR
jgi:hypothetical protein